MHELPEYSSELGPPITKAPFFGAQFEQAEQIPFVVLAFHLRNFLLLTLLHWHLMHLSYL